MKRDVSQLMRTLIREQEDNTVRAVASGREDELTSFGVPLLHLKDNRFTIDLSKIRVFRNLHTFVQLLIDEVLEQCGFGIADIMVRRRVDPHLTPDFAAVGLDWVMVYARLDAAESLPFYHRHFGNCMQVVFRSLQSERWGGALFPEFFGLACDEANGEGREVPPALLFPFHLQAGQGDAQGHYFLVEYNRTGRFLRITLEDAVTSRLQLKHIPHRVVDKRAEDSFLSDVYTAAEQIHQGILRECMNNRADFTEIPSHQYDLFSHMRRAGLPDLQALRFTWPTDDIQSMLIEKTEKADGTSQAFEMLLKEIQLLEDSAVLACLARGNLVEMTAGPYPIYFDVSRYGSCLNVSFDRPRTVQALKDYLAPMPVLSRAAAERQDSMRRVRLFLIHHVTAEVIGLLDAFTKAGCSAITTLFVKYAGVVPEAYLETLMSLPPDTYRFYGLQKIESREKIGGRYALSHLFSPLAGLDDIDRTIFSGEYDFFASMRYAAGHLFLKEAVKAGERHEKLLLVEDGGYLAPLLNRFCLEEQTVGDVFARFQAAPPAGSEGISFAIWLEGVLLGGVEHTRNGYDYNAEVLDEFGMFHFPVASIAVSELKRGAEARECAVAILNATENILHRMGMLLSRRNILILGSQGAIGGYLKDELRRRNGPSHLYGVDIAVSGHETGRTPEVPNLDSLAPGVLEEIDMVIGVIGRSIFQAVHLERMLLEGQQKKIIFVSGSTKTVEFTDLEAYLQGLRDQTAPKISGHAVRIDLSPLRDLQSGVLQGYEVSVAFPACPAKDKRIYLLGELMPINFLYYGIPMEIVDEVMAQLFSVACGLVKRQQSPDKAPKRLLAVDREIDIDANPLLSLGTNTPGSG